MNTVHFEFLYLLSLFSPADLVTMLILVGIIAKLGDEDDAITMRGAFALMLSVGGTMFTVSIVLSALGAPRWVSLIVYFAVWWGVLMYKARIAPVAATVAVACLVGVNLLGHLIQDQLVKAAQKQVSKPGVDPSLQKLDEMARGKK